MEAFDRAKQQADYDLSRGQSARDKLKLESEINLAGHRPRVRRYAHGLKQLIRIGQGPEKLLRKSSKLGAKSESDVYFEADGTDVVEAHEWKCVRTLDGVRIFEDMANKKTGKGVLVKAVGVVEASADTVFDVLLSLDRHRRYEWDMLTGDVELIESLDGHCDVVYGTLDLRKLSWWQSKRDFVFSRRWFHGQDGTYTILHFPTEYKKRPPKSGYRRIKMIACSWEISNIGTSSSLKPARCLVTLILEIRSKAWFKWKNNEFCKFERTLPFGMLSQVAGLKEYIGANPALTFESSTVVVQSKTSGVSISSNEFEDAMGSDEFYDAIGTDSSSSDEDSGDEVSSKQDKKVKLKNVSWAIASLAMAEEDSVSKSFLRRHWEGYKEFWGERFSFLDNYSRFIKRDKPLPSWSEADVEEFIASEPVHGPTLKTAREAAKFGAVGGLLGAVSTAGVTWKYSRSLHGTALSLGAGAVFGWTFGQEVANHWLQLYRMDTMASQVKFMEWWQNKVERQS